MNKHSAASRRCGYGFSAEQMSGWDGFEGVLYPGGVDNFGGDHFIDFVDASYRRLGMRIEGELSYRKVHCAICGVIGERGAWTPEMAYSIRCDPLKHNTYYNTFQIGSESSA